MTLKDFQTFVNSILEEADLPDWKAVVEERDSNYKAVASCDSETKTIFVSTVLRNRPPYEVRAAVEREIGHARSPKKYHRRNGSLIEKSSHPWLSARKASLQELVSARFSRVVLHASSRRSRRA